MLMSMCILSLTMIYQLHRINDKKHVETLQQEAVSMVAALRANSSFPYLVIPEIVQSIGSMIGITVDYFQSETIHLLHNCGISDEVPAFTLLSNSSVTH